MRMDDHEEHAIETCVPQFTAGMIRCMIDETRDMIPENEEDELLRVYGMMINEALKTYMLVVNSRRFADRERHLASIRETISETLDAGLNIKASRFISHAWMSYLDKIMEDADKDRQHTNKME